MTRDEILRMAREAGLYATRQTSDPYDWQAIRDERFAALVAAAEREACADEVTDMGNKGWDCYHAAEAIRARSQQ